jgi:hypothetical protein
LKVVGKKKVQPNSQVCPFSSHAIKGSRGGIIEWSFYFYSLHS